MSLTDTINAIRAAPAAARATVMVTNDPVGGATTVRVGARQHTFSVDEPEALGGSDAAASPLEYALAEAVDEHCPLFDLVRNPVPVERNIRVG